MGIMEKYMLWQDKENTKPISHETIELFKTNLTLDQLKILNRIETKNKYESLGLIIVCLCYGIFIGAFIGYYYGVLSVL